MFRHLLTLTCAAIFGAATAMPIPARAAPLITAEEAALPPQKGAVPNSGRGITRGPKIQVPEAEAGVQTSPMRFQVKFQTFGGSSIDLDALKVTYTGIDMPDALLPPGDHLLRIDIKDSDGRVSSISFLLKIAP